MYFSSIFLFGDVKIVRIAMLRTNLTSRRTLGMPSGEAKANALIRFVRSETILPIQKRKEAVKIYSLRLLLTASTTVVVAATRDYKDKNDNPKTRIVTKAAHQYTSFLLSYTVKCLAASAAVVRHCVAAASATAAATVNTVVAATANEDY